MRKLLYLGFAAIVALALNGCGGHSDPVFVAQILSDPGVDGDIAEDIDTGILSSPVLASGTGSVRVGIDPSIGLFGTEYRGFLHFPLDGSTGFDAVPADATIVSATLEIFIDTVQFSPTVPVRMDLVWFPPPLISSDYDVTVLPSLLTRGTFNILSTDPIPPRVGVLIDVTPLMREAQRLGLADFQVRFLLDP
ncbi:MAG: hypothetical protein A2X88_01415, partial [Deltaproteobacteria bacterium GWC2_65_14]